MGNEDDLAEAQTKVDELVLGQAALTAAFLVKVSSVLFGPPALASSRTFVQLFHKA